MSSICSICGKISKRLREHLRRVHSEEFFECFHCQRTFKRKDTLERHVIAIHIGICTPNAIQKRKKKKCVPRKITKPHSNQVTDGQEDGNILHTPVFECTECHKKFNRKYSLKRHSHLVHGIGNRTDYPLYECSYCSKTFKQKIHLRSHVQICLSKKHSQRTQYTCVIPSCPFSGYNHDFMMKHYECEHNIQFQWEKLEFKTREEFQEWLICLQTDQACYCQFSIVQTWESRTSYNQKLRCHRSGIVPPTKEKRIRFERLIGSKRLDGFCPAEIIIKESKDDKICRIKMQTTHVGHATNSVEELAFLSHYKKTRSDITTKLALGVPQDIILTQDQSSVVSSTQPGQTDLINYANLANIAMLNGLNTPYQAPYKDDAQNILNFIHEHQESVHFFKPQGAEDDSEFGVLSKNDFALVYMDEFQENLLKKFARNVIAYDSTYRTNPNDFLLHTILILDEECKGVAVAFLLSNRNDVTVLEIFLSVIKKRVGLLAPRLIMTDMQKSFINAFLVIMTHPESYLWYTWHVYEAWRKNQKKIADPKKKREVIKRCYKLSQITDEDLFEDELMKFIHDDDGDLRVFIEYFKDTYASHASKWAYCYRIQSKINTNMVLESFHNFFKSRSGNKKKIKTAHQYLCSIMTYSELKKKYRKAKTVHPRITEKLEILRDRHHKATKYIESQQYTVESFTLEGTECTHMWLISVFSNKGHKTSYSADGQDPDEKYADDNLEMYIVQRHPDLREHTSSLKCTLCGITFSEYTCTCIDYLIKCNMCKHIHTVVLHCKHTNTACKCSPEIEENEMEENEIEENEIEENEIEENEIEENEIEVNEIEVNEIEVNEIEVNEIEVSEIEVDEIEVMDNVEHEMIENISCAGSETIEDIPNEMIESPHNETNENERLEEELKKDISRSLDNIEDLQTLIDIQKFVFSRGPALAKTEK